MKKRSPSRHALIVLAAVAVLATGCADLLDLPRLDDKDLRRSTRLAQSSRIYDGSGALLTALHGPENRTVVPLRRIGKKLRNAVIAIEDERFYDHEGVDARAVIRALIANVTSGDIREGGSTITQQYVKNALIAPGETAERTLQRKIREAALARQLEGKLGKDEILERYLNIVYFGNGAYGVQAASKLYFGKPSKKLSLAQAATLAGLIQSPEDHDPLDSPKKALDRRNLVLNKMQQLDMIDADHAERAKGRDLNVKSRVDTTRYPAPYFVDYVHRLIKYDERFSGVGKTPEQREQQLFTGGLRIHTTIDMAMQKAAERAVKEALPEPGDPHASLVAIDPETGFVKALVGGRDWFVRKKKDPYAKLNLAVQAEPGLGCQRNNRGNCRTDYVAGPAPGTGRHAGSAFKIFALVEALRQGIPLSKVYSGPNCLSLNIPEQLEPWRACNYGGSSFGALPLLEATARSVNTVFAQLILEVGTQKVVDIARDMGIRTPLGAYPSSVLGSNEVNPLGMASAYGTLAAGGTHHPPVAITKVTDASGEVLYQDESAPVEVLDPAIAYLATQALQKVITGGTASRFGQIGRPAAGKTGTAQEYRDAWFAGYTPDLVAAVWVGYPGGQIEMKPSCAFSNQPCRATRVISGAGVTGGSFPTMIWSAFMRAALEGIPARDFSGADVELVRVTLDTRGDTCLAEDSTPRRFREKAVFPKGTEPTETCDENVTRVQVPDVFGLSAGDATRLLEQAGFDVARAEQRSDSHAPGTVIDQSPTAGELAAQGSVVNIAVSSGSGGGGNRVTVPNVVGMKQANAKKTLEDSGFNVEVVEKAESSPGRAKSRRGRVWRQAPAGGTRAKRGSKVTIWVNP